MIDMTIILWIVIYFVVYEIIFLWLHYRFEVNKEEAIIYAFILSAFLISFQQALIAEGGYTYLIYELIVVLFIIGVFKLNGKIERN